MQSSIDQNAAGPVPSVIRALALASFAVGTLLVSGMAAAADGAIAQAQARYKQDRAACSSGQSYQDRTSCLREAGAALQESKRGRLGGNQSAYEKNRRVRCDRLPAGDREDCLRRMDGDGTVSGSVESGGVFRELRTTVPAQ